jgi:hypothetical protein
MPCWPCGHDFQAAQTAAPVLCPGCGAKLGPAAAGLLALSGLALLGLVVSVLVYNADLSAALQTAEKRQEAEEARARERTDLNRAQANCRNRDPLARGKRPPSERRGLPQPCVAGRRGR